MPTFSSRIHFLGCVKTVERHNYLINLIMVAKIIALYIEEKLLGYYSVSKIVFCIVVVVVYHYVMPYNYNSLLCIAMLLFSDCSIKRDCVFIVDR